MVIDAIKAARELHSEGMLHRKLIWRLFLLASISIVTGYIVLFNIFKRGLDWNVALGLACAGFLFGFFIFYHMNPLKWDKRKELLIVTKVDKLGFLVIGIYIALRLFTDFYLDQLYHNIVLVTGLTLATVFGVSFGRLVASLKAIKETHTKVL